MQLIKHGCGIDMAKDKFNACLTSIDSGQQLHIRAQSSFPNTLSGFEVFLAWAQKHANSDIPLFFLMEATGIYYEGLAWYLNDHNHSVSVVLPNKAKKYKIAWGSSPKTTG